jgi:hypothetical protein
MSSGGSRQTYTSIRIRTRTMGSHSFNIRVSRVWVKVLDHLMVFPPVKSLEMERHLLVWDQT